MLRGKKVCLRARLRSDIEVLHEPLRVDPELWMLTDNDPWTPESLDVALARFDKRQAEEQTRFVGFTVATLVDVSDTLPASTVVGDGCLWGIDLHARSAHIGLTLIADARGHGLGRETVDLLVDYAFRVRGLHRLQCETHSDNAAMLGAAEAAGFRREGELRQAGWRSGRHVDEVLLGLLAEEWRGQR
ncbi:MAG: GNAT family N-acetyltransferase [Pseudonocardiales bacterium]|nr:MAG: GNAT family N-acetyltransferase [Pseudonocardiales bacterium]